MITSAFYYVSFDIKNNKWVSNVEYKGTKVTGHFDTEIAAAKYSIFTMITVGDDCGEFFMEKISFNRQLLLEKGANDGKSICWEIY